MSGVEELYREIILDHYRNPRQKGELPAPALKVEGVNPLCGDQLVLYLNSNGNQVDDVRVVSTGCSISVASASMMAEAIMGKSVSEVESIISQFKELMLQKNGTSIDPEKLGDLEALQGVKKYPIRIKCALLSWNTLLEALKSLKSRKQAEKVVME
ncbi:MAG: SUF system NifU family Fe-S cluster assembly protein [candidate division Zixibacteria bacterium]|nr:SUF system NifU family Fe-S cluster assembly protein [candidate division Zixibacteria bacterium]